MNKAEARQVLREAMSELRQRSYQDLVHDWLDQPDCHSRLGPSGTKYQIEVQAFWDKGKPGPLRVLGSIDDGTLLRSISPLCEDFIMAADSTFIDE